MRWLAESRFPDVAAQLITLPRLRTPDRRAAIKGPMDGLYAPGADLCMAKDIIKRK
jgi:hypothetical protein